MSGWRVVLLRIAAMFLVILVGWVARRRKTLNAESTATLGRFVVDVTFPALVFVQMLKSINADALRESWYAPFLCVAILILGELVGLAVASFFCAKDQRRTFIFLVSICNWVYLPLPIAEALYPQNNEGLRTILLFNAGAQIALWSLGVWTLRGGRPDRAALWNLLKNPGLIATVAGIALALMLPELGDLAKCDPLETASYFAYIGRALFEGLSLTGNLTIALSLIVIGSQLGGLDLSDHRRSQALGGVLFARLLLTPVVVVALAQLAKSAGINIPDMYWMLGYLVAFMPVAVSCSMFTERFGGDTSLAARATFYSTLISIGSVPALFYLAQSLKL
ncbi:MAG: AEC family transporter [Planctomycetota bacterium]